MNTKTDLISIDQYYRIRHGSVERVREHMRRRRRWAKACVSSS